MTYIRLKFYNLSKVLWFSISEEVILAEERTTQEERNHIMEARKRAANKRRKLKSMGKSKSTETDDDDEDADEGNIPCFVSKKENRSRGIGGFKVKSFFLFWSCK